MPAGWTRGWTVALGMIFLAVQGRGAEGNVVEAYTAESDVPSGMRTSPAPPRFGLSFAIYRQDLQGIQATVQDGNASPSPVQDLALHQQLFLVSYRVSPAWTLLLAVSHLTHVAETHWAGGLLLESAAGLGDTRILGISPVLATRGHVLLLEAGLSLPTGSILQERAGFPGFRHGYSMQLGSGTFDPVGALTYQFNSGNFTQGLRAQFIGRFYRNGLDYRLGNELAGSLWSEYRLTSWFAPLLRFAAKTRAPLEGADPALERSPGTEYYYHPQRNWELSLNARTTIPLDGIPGAAFSLEAGIPLLEGAQNRDGVRTRARYFASAGVQLTL